MSANKQEEVITVEKYEFECTRCFELGIGSGLEQTSSIVLARATLAFERNQDEIAKLFRELANSLKSLGEIKSEEARQKKKE
jgi:late competence protein required for DNA uptake (superfamily II DNA/RNA helicase)